MNRWIPSLAASLALHGLLFALPGMPLRSTAAPPAIRLVLRDLPPPAPPAPAPSKEPGAPETPMPPLSSALPAQSSPPAVETPPAPVVELSPPVAPPVEPAREEPKKIAPPPTAQRPAPPTEAKRTVKSTPSNQKPPTKPAAASVPKKQAAAPVPSPSPTPTQSGRSPTAPVQANPNPSAAYSGTPDGPSSGKASTVPAPEGPVDVAILKVLKKPAPEYPMTSRKRGEEGRVTILITIQSGRVTEASVERSSGFTRLDNAALQAVRRWIFDHQGTVRARVPVRFTLK